MDSKSGLIHFLFTATKLPFIIWSLCDSITICTPQATAFETSSINIEPVGEDFKLKYKFSREENTITEDITALNTGFGITYVLPILIAVLSAGKDAIVLIENPEANEIGRAHV